MSQEVFTSTTETPQLSDQELEEFFRKFGHVREKHLNMINSILKESDIDLMDFFEKSSDVVSKIHYLYSMQLGMRNSSIRKRSEILLEVEITSIIKEAVKRYLGDKVVDIRERVEKKIVS